VARSYRAGIELEYGIEINRQWRWSANATFSDNRLQSYAEFVDSFNDQFEYLDNVLLATRENTPIAFSPAIIAASMLQYTPISNLEIALQTKYVGSQYADNSGLASRKIDAYLLNDIRIEYHMPVKNFFEEARIALMVNNLLDLRYVSNGYVYPYLFDGNLVNEVYVYPQAGRNFMLNLYLSF
jgi:iron complex outermembrane receptor protein